MAETAPTENTILNDSEARSTKVGDVPDTLRRRYLTDDYGGPGLGFYVDATILRPAFRDRGYRIDVSRADPSAVRDAVGIALHRGWGVVAVRGGAAFRREAWMVGSSQGLEVRGYRPTERDLQDLERRSRAPIRPTERTPDTAARAQLRVIDALVRDRIGDESRRQAIMTSARDRIADWLERGATFERAGQNVLALARGTASVNGPVLRPMFLLRLTRVPSGLHLTRPRTLASA